MNTQQLRVDGGVSRKNRYRVKLAENEQEVRSCQQLRYRIFAQELGAHLHTPEHGLDIDEYDAFCRHLMVWDDYTHNLVATTRVMDRAHAEAGIGYYSESEFHLQNILELPGNIIEVGRTCVHPDYRAGHGLAMLWVGLSQVLDKSGAGYLMGCASIPVRGDFSYVHRLQELLLEQYATSMATCAQPKYPLPEPDYWLDTEIVMPALLRTYLRAGAKICGELCWDADFDVADALVLLDKRLLTPRFARHFGVS